MIVLKVRTATRYYELLLQGYDYMFWKIESVVNIIGLKSLIKTKESLIGTRSLFTSYLPEPKIVLFESFDEQSEIATMQNKYE